MNMEKNEIYNKNMKCILESNPYLWETLQEQEESEYDVFVDTSISGEKIVGINLNGKDWLDSGLVNELMIKTQNYDVSVRTQNCIRRILSENGDTVVKNDKTFYIMGDLLPSAYFYIDNIYDGSELSELVIHGGGLGHGAGMSQNGAKCLANKGYSAEQILNYYYNDIELRFE